MKPITGDDKVRVSGKVKRKKKTATWKYTDSNKNWKTATKMPSVDLVKIEIEGYEDPEDPDTSGTTIALPTEAYKIKFFNDTSMVAYCIFIKGGKKSQWRSVILNDSPILDMPPDKLFRVQLVTPANASWKNEMVIIDLKDEYDIMFKN